MMLLTTVTACLGQQKYMVWLKRGAAYKAHKISRNVAMVRPFTN